MKRKNIATSSQPSSKDDSTPSGPLLTTSEIYDLLKNNQIPLIDALYHSTIYSRNHPETADTDLLRNHLLTTLFNTKTDIDPIKNLYYTFLNFFSLDYILKRYPSNPGCMSASVAKTTIPYLLDRIATTYEKTRKQASSEQLLKLGQLIISTYRYNDIQWLKYVLNNRYQDIVVQEAIDGILNHIRAGIRYTLGNLANMYSLMSDFVEKAYAQSKFLESSNILLSRDAFLIKLKRDEQISELSDQHMISFNFLVLAHVLTASLGGRNFQIISNERNPEILNALKKTLRSQFIKAMQTKDRRSEYDDLAPASLKLLTVSFYIIQLTSDRNLFQNALNAIPETAQTENPEAVVQEHLQIMFKSLSEYTNALTKLGRYIKWEECVQDITKGLAPRRRVIPEIAVNATERELARRNNAFSQVYVGRYPR